MQCLCGALHPGSSITRPGCCCCKPVECPDRRADSAQGFTAVTAQRSLCVSAVPALCHCADVSVTHQQEAAAAKAKAEERAALLFAKKKTTAVERKMKKEQKDEAERHIAAQEALVRHNDSSSSSCVCLRKGCSQCLLEHCDIHEAVVVWRNCLCTCSLHFLAAWGASILLRVSILQSASIPPGARILPGATILHGSQLGRSSPRTLAYTTYWASQSSSPTRTLMLL